MLDCIVSQSEFRVALAQFWRKGCLSVLSQRRNFLLQKFNFGEKKFLVYCLNGRISGWKNPILEKMMFKCIVSKEEFPVARIQFWGRGVFSVLSQRRNFRLQKYNFGAKEFLAYCVKGRISCCKSPILEKRSF